MPQGQAAVGRRPEGEGVQEMAEAMAGGFVGDAQGAEHQRLEGGLVDPDGASAQFHPVENHIVGPGAHLPRVALQQGEVLLHGTGEGMVLRHPALFLVVPVEEGEFRHPEEVEAVLGDELVGFRHLQADPSQGGARHPEGAVGGQQEQVSGLGVQRFLQGLGLFGGEEFGGGAGEGAGGVHLQHHQSLGSHELGGFRQLVGLLAADGGGQALAVEALDGALLLQGGAEGGEGGVGEEAGEVLHLQAETGVGLSAPYRVMASFQVTRRKGRESSIPFTSFMTAARRRSVTPCTSSSSTKLISRSIWVNSGWRSARRSSSRKHRAIWKYFSTPPTIRSCLYCWGLWGRA